MTIAELVTLAALLAALAVLSWSRAQRLYENPYGTVLQRIASATAALAFLCAGFADWTFHRQLASAAVTGVITEIRYDHNKYGSRLESGTIQVQPKAGNSLSLALNDQIHQLKSGETIHVLYDPSALLVRQVDMLDSGYPHRRIDNEAADRHRLNPWFYAALFCLAVTALPLRRQKPHLGNIARPDRSNSQYGAGG
jgi:hypothetical protein